MTLHQYNQDGIFNERELKKIGLLKEKINKLKKETNVKELFSLTDELTMKGYTGIHFIEYMLKSNYTANDILCIEQFKNNIKSEKVLIFCILIKIINTFDKT